MTTEFWNISGLSSFLRVKASTIYAMVERKEIPHYRIGRLIRFRPDDVQKWLEGRRMESIAPEKKAKEVLKGVRNQRIDVDRIVKKSVEEVKNRGYNRNHGKPDQDKAKKEVSRETL